jgi:ABC-type glycerol-3-phosphate transport system substrate-binding protein
MINRYSKHPELAYYFLQWLTGPTKGDEAIAHPKGFWDPMRRSNLTNEAILPSSGNGLSRSPWKMPSMPPAANAARQRSYFNILDKHPHCDAGQHAS